MFDPTAFDNLKVVLEGAVYDLELNGELKIVNRKDLVDLASLSRTYSIYFHSRIQMAVHAKIELSAGLEELSGELLFKKRERGASIQISYEGKEGCLTKNHYEYLLRSWEAREIEWLEVYSNKKPSACRAVVHFDRFITEEMIDELPALVRHLLQTLDEIPYSS
ncbi:hypothetical protein JOC86_000802 [Bacillus pakistanensis]|uniref:Uncharacterized protein n=1 Tax=Rossellomorea pakistanensis TaxID=992288 RepID=A0ABS2N903_9BACI|nr:hypothetical protein [Bacillus pakistanensis]MBM7584265.1 hypothetical protein [Bacillus pakistanensis]